MDSTNNIDELVNWINDDSKVLTQKQKNKLNKNINNNKSSSNKKISKEDKNKLNKYSRDSNPYYKKTLTERIQLQKQYENMLNEEKLYKDKRMKEIMETMRTMSEEQQQEYLNELLSKKEIEI